MLACALAMHPPAGAQPTAAGAPATDILMILTVRANGVVRGDFHLVHRPDGDYWVAAGELAQLQVSAPDGARRTFEGEDYVSLRALGATGFVFKEEELSLEVLFPAEAISGTRINLLRPPERVPVIAPRHSLIMSYRLSVLPPLRYQKPQAMLDTDMNLRIGRMLLRQEMRANSRPQTDERRLSRGVTQLVWDDERRALRATAGDLVSSAGPYGTAITAAGLQLRKSYEITPDTVRQPLASLRASTPLPADVEVAVDGQVVYRGRVGPGPIALDNLLMYGGTRDVRLTVTDISGRRQVVEQPFLFTDAVLARGLHDYSYFAGRRSDIGPGGRPRYREAAWQAYHRYGFTDSLTLGGGGEGSAQFTNLGLGGTVRSDALGLFGMDTFASRDRENSRHARGWSARYTYVLPSWTVTLARRRFGEGFRTFTTSAATPYLRDESRLAVSTRVGIASVGLELARRSDALESRRNAALRLSGQITRGVTLAAHLERGRVNGMRDWAASVFLRVELERQRWVASSFEANPGTRELNVETGRQVGQGEGLGYRVGTNTSWQGQGSSSYAYGSAQWNLKPVTLEAFGSNQLRGGDSQYLELAASGAAVEADGEWGLSRRITDSFVIARLGVPVEGIEVSLNNQVQGTTDGAGMLFLPGVGAYGRQDLSINDKQLALQYNLSERRRTISLPYRSGVVVDFGGRRVRAIAGMAWRAGQRGREPVASQTWTLAGPAGTLAVETSRLGDFYVEHAPPGRYTGTLRLDGRTYSCVLDVPDFPEPVHELKEGVNCD